MRSIDRFKMALQCMGLIAAGAVPVALMGCTASTGERVLHEPAHTVASHGAAFPEVTILIEWDTSNDSYGASVKLHGSGSTSSGGEAKLQGALGSGTPEQDETTSAGDTDFSTISFTPITASGTIKYDHDKNGHFESSKRVTYKGIKTLG